ncbi:mediator of RNA polymerase II transcription subunit 23 isoform X1 [Hydra vulgaris]|uniref:mediator of RNA polymerase II transcription subunit 23 isoform X1 n=1 Tax=Hydra vulgaris TaxID=6087 RepID=UPI001F5F0725|nr:mediator of RNA polymerase II transcription subunit 23 [Hydra vulgaris]
MTLPKVGSAWLALSGSVLTTVRKLLTLGSKYYFLLQTLLCNITDFSMTDLKAHLETLLEETLVYQAVETAFFGLIIYNEEDENNRKESFLKSFKQFWNSIPHELQSMEIISLFVDFANTQYTVARLSHIFSLLKFIVENDVIPARKACEAVLNSSHLKFENSNVWIQSLNFLFYFLPLMDYKSVRAVFSILLCKVKSELPERIMNSQLYLVEETKRIIDLGLDRSVCLLPSYFVLNEIYKLYPVDNFHPHWVLGKDFTSFTSSFKPLAQMVSIIGHSSLTPVIGYTSFSNVWNLDPATLRYPLKGPLPYNKKLLESQKNLIRYVISQPYSREFVCAMLGLKKQQKQRCEALEEVLVDLIMMAMEKNESSIDGDNYLKLLWQHLSSQLIFFILFQFVSFPHMVKLLHKKLLNKNLTKGRDQLMWVLLQFISGSIQKSSLSAFSHIIKLFETLYPGKEPLPVPTSINADNVSSFSMACIWVHLSKKARIESNQHDTMVSYGAPITLSKQLEFLSERVQKPHDDYEMVLLCNAYSTSSDVFLLQMNEIMSKICDSTTVKLPKNCLASGSVVPLDMKLLDSLTAHTKMSLIHNIVTKINQFAASSTQLHQDQQQVLALSPALVETYSRLLVYMEIELLGIKSFISQVLPNVIKRKAWSILHGLLEMFSYRLHHIQSHYRMSLISSLHNVVPVSDLDKVQIQICVVTTVLKLIMGFGSSDLQAQLSSQRYTTEPSVILSKDCEELNKVLILTMARAIHVTGADSLPFTWCESIVKESLKLTPHRWSSYTLASFPVPLQLICSQESVVEDVNGKVLMSVVEKHHRKLKTLNEEETVSYFNEKEQAEIFLCIVWKVLLEHNRITPVCHQILTNLSNKSHSSKPLANGCKFFADYLVFDFKLYVNNPQNAAQVSKRFQYLNDIIWKYEIIPLDRLILSLTLRPHDEKNSQICFYIIKWLLLQPAELRLRVKKFASENTPQHWTQVDWNERHTAYHDQYPERYHYEGILEANNITLPNLQYLPTYFGNICLRFLPVFEILIHRLIEVSQWNTLDHILKEYSPLFKFLEQPITYLYNTLHYYEKKLKENAIIKRKLMLSICTSSGNLLDGIFSTEIIEFINKESDTWVPNIDYFVELFQKFITATFFNKSRSSYPSFDWRFNEFLNSTTLALYATCLELMILPISAEDVGHAIVDLVTMCHGSNQTLIKSNYMEWINTAALLLTSLPRSYLNVVNIKVCDVIQTTLANKVLSSTSTLPSFFDFHEDGCNLYEDRVLAMFHATWLHATMGQFYTLSRFLQETLKPLIHNETQLLFVFCMFGPFLQRFQEERSGTLFEIAKEFYYLLEQVCRNCVSLVFVDLIADFLYHIKYMFAGDHLRDAVESTLHSFHPSLQNKLKFMVFPKKEDISHQ